MWAEEVRVRRRGAGGGAFLGWMLLGAGIGAGFGLDVPSGLFLALALVFGGGVLVVRQGPAPAQLGVVSGLGALPLAIAWLNRHGPGEYCADGASGCIAQSSPWPFVLVGIALILVGLAAFRRTSRPPGSTPGPRP